LKRREKSLGNCEIRLPSWSPLPRIGATQSIESFTRVAACHEGAAHP
jgi:hypothetical protein